MSQLDGLQPPPPFRQPPSTIVIPSHPFSSPLLIARSAPSYLAARASFFNFISVIPANAGIQITTNPSPDHSIPDSSFLSTQVSMRVSISSAVFRV